MKDNRDLALNRVQKITLNKVIETLEEIEKDPKYFDLTENEVKVLRRAQDIIKQRV